MALLSIMGKNKKTLSFEYFDDVNFVYERTCTICDPVVAGTVAKEFLKRKEEEYHKAYYEYVKKAKENPELAIIEKLVCKNKEIICVTMFDSDQELYDKYRKMVGRVLTDDERNLVSVKFKNNVRSMVEYSIFKKGKIR